jgi:FkbM family methyltransferase
MRWFLKQLSEEAAGHVQFSSGFRFINLNRDSIHADILVAEHKNEEFTLRAEGPWVKLTFHTHAWCGASTIIVNGSESREDFYSEQHGFRDMLFHASDEKTIDIRIRTGEPPNPAAKANEIWIVSVEFAQMQKWSPRSQPITQTCILTQGTYGAFLTLATDTVIGASIVSKGVWAPHDVALFKNLISPGMTVLDVGANIGHHTVVYGKLVGRTGRVISFEPQTTIFRLLSANTVLNGGFNTDLIQACVGEAEGFVHLYPVNYSDRTNFGALGVDPDPDRRRDRGEKCRVLKLDDALAELPHPVDRVDFIKIDVQSFELYVLKGAAEILRKFKPTLFLEVSPHWMAEKYDYKEIYRFLSDLGYVIDHLHDSSIAPGEIKEWSGKQGEEWDILARHPQGPHGGLDIAAVRDVVFAAGTPHAAPILAAPADEAPDASGLVTRWMTFLRRRAGRAN